MTILACAFGRDLVATAPYDNARSRNDSPEHAFEDIGPVRLIAQARITSPESRSYQEYPK
jgi:hypothetical protein